MLSTVVTDPSWETYATLFGPSLIFNVIPGLAIGLLTRAIVRDDWKACWMAFIGGTAIPIVVGFGLGVSWWVTWGYISVMIAGASACAGVEAGSRLTVRGKRLLPPKKP